MKKFKLTAKQGQGVLERLVHLGYHYHPGFVDAHNLREAKPSSLKNLTVYDREAKAMIAGFQSFLSNDFNRHSYAVNGRTGYPDGELGPATLAHITEERCEVPDFFPPEHEAYKQGTGNWKGCWGIGDFHCCRDKVDDRLMPAHVKRNWPAIVTTVQAAYAQMGLLWLPSKDWSEYNTDLYWKTKSTGWIGLASVMNGRTCGKSGMNSYATYYAKSKPDAWIVQHWSVLMLHEKFHNCGFMHSNGGIGNPSLRPGTKPTWIGDVSESRMRAKFGGVPVPIPGGPVTPPPVSPPPVNPPGPPVVGFRPSFADGTITIRVPENCPAGDYKFVLTPEITF